ncbi:MAG: hypothetical protein M1837_002250 [Sclerophora amabilis]|nr:MAG: hypothetical protein M1837_002250 [Sclerophora amabilis]
MTKSEPFEVPLDTLTHFGATQWCRHLLDDSAYTPVDTLSRHPKSSTEDSVFAETLSTPSTISHCLSLRRKSGIRPLLEPSNPPLEVANADPEPAPAELLTLLTLGSGVNGHPQVAHGGVAALILDELLSFLVGFHQARSSYTVSLNTTFKNPMPTPGTVLMRGWLLRRQGRKLWARGRIESGQGLVYASAEGLWVEVRHSL